MSMDVVIPAASGLIGAGIGAVIAERFQSRRAKHDRLNAIRVDQFEKARDFAVVVHEGHRHLSPLVDIFDRVNRSGDHHEPSEVLSSHEGFFDQVRAGVAVARYSAVDGGVRFALDNVIAGVDDFDELYAQIRQEVGTSGSYDAAKDTAAEVDKLLPHFTMLTDQVVTFARTWLYESTFERGDGSGYYESWWKRVRKRVNKLLTRTYGG
ncbi:Hypothetical protein CGLY_07375 [Corynebacterium glyciniphilum AJ 3170]|uniref:Uncharacterized protein n=1 Tax=Corynebacterium glyciniphilum AJ 3170 TaxID=1404245 RepID=X5E914_9CORY|nr:hypothetical protein [Corynebacterium glyciniphilum]AHW63920.1 Hypothetical protein CGLY_07375 [Corynebacterium glyciniphilum AJ 3170]